MSSPIDAPAQAAEFEFTALNEARNYRRALLRDFSSYLRGNVLEVGAGIGQITSGLLQVPDIQLLSLIEPDTAFCARLRAQFPQLGVHQGTIADFQSERNWNAILSVNVLEHIEADGKELANYHRLLRSERGALCLFVPARPELYAPIDKDFGHYRRYTRRDLQKKLEEAGFAIAELRYYNLAGYFAWWLNFCLLKKRNFDADAVRLFDRAIFPTVHFLESRICSPPIGQSLLAVATAY
jgi:SAM-dependent methyltransferase